MAQMLRIVTNMLGGSSLEYELSTLLVTTIADGQMTVTAGNVTVWYSVSDAKNYRYVGCINDDIEGVKIILYGQDGSKYHLRTVLLRHLAYCRNRV